VRVGTRQASAPLAHIDAAVWRSRPGTPGARGIAPLKIGRRVRQLGIDRLLHRRDRHGRVIIENTAARYALADMAFQINADIPPT
jgi:hypothetical protein